MPIITSISFEPISDQEFGALDQSVMRCAYAVHNKFGRRFDEQIYENELAARLCAEGLAVATQVPVVVTHAGFEKTYYLDLVVNHMLYELKVVTSLTEEHEAQCLHYAMLHNIRLVKLLNFGEPKNRGKLLRNALDASERKQAVVQNAAMLIITSHCEELLRYLMEIIDDWGTHLSSNLYNSALIEFFGGEDHCVQRIELRSKLLLLGTHRIQLYSPGLAFIVTSLAREQAAYEHHLKVLRAHTNLKAIQWINFNHSLIEIKTIIS